MLAWAAAGLASGTASYLGQVSGVSGVDAFDDVVAVLSGRGVLETAAPDPQGRFAFYGLPAGSYAVQVRKPGYESSPSRAFRVGAGGQMSGEGTDNEFALRQLAPDTFVFHWEEDQSTAGYDYASRVNKPPEIQFLDEGAATADGASADQLLHDYNVSLIDGAGGSWTHEHAYRLLQTMESIPQRKRDPYRVQSLPPSQWFIASGHLASDIRIDRNAGDGAAVVRISADTFIRASPRIALVDGKKGKYYSQRLHHAVVRFVTDNGRNRDAFERILNERFGVTTRINRHLTYEELTAGTTGEPASRFQEFHPEEIVRIINTFEEMPSGMHAIPGLKYLVRRLDGSPNPTTSAPAVAYTSAGYIEFMEEAFKNTSVQYIHRLIIHEKSHFLWEYLLDDGLKRNWTTLGGWHLDASDPDGWSTTKQTEWLNSQTVGAVWPSPP